MTSNQRRVRLLACLHFLILPLITNGAPPNSVVTIPDLDPLDASELVMLEELSEWVTEDGEGERSLPQVIRSRPTSFEVFRSYHEADVRNRSLEVVPYGREIQGAAETHGVDALLLAAMVETESSFDAHAVSHRGAIGLMQLMPAYVEAAEDELCDPRKNLDLGAAYLKTLLNRFGGDLELALAAYNAGPTTVRRYRGVPPFRETREYVARVLDLYVDHHRQVWQASDSHAYLGVS